MAFYTNYKLLRDIKIHHDLRLVPYREFKSKQNVDSKDDVVQKSQKVVAREIIYMPSNREAQRKKQLLYERIRKNFSHTAGRSMLLAKKSILEDTIDDLVVKDALRKFTKHGATLLDHRY